MFALLETLQELSAADVRALHPETSFPPEFGRECLEPFGIVPVEFDPAPDVADGETLEPGALRRDGDRVVRGWSVLPAPAPTAADVDAERDRRISAGFEFGGVWYQSRPGDRENIAGKTQEAFMAIVGGAQPGDLRWSRPDQDFAWIAADNSLVPMDAQTVVEFGKAALAHKEAHVFMARQIKDMQPIPADYMAQSYWP